MKQPCAIDPACTVRFPRYCAGEWRAACERTAAAREALTPEQREAWCAEDVRAEALEHELVSLALPAPEILGATPPATPRPPPPSQIPALSSPLQRRIAELSREGLRPVAIAEELDLWPQTVRRVLHRLAQRAA